MILQCRGVGVSASVVTTVVMAGAAGRTWDLSVLAEAAAAAAAAVPAVLPATVAFAAPLLRGLRLTATVAVTSRGL